MQCVEGLYWRGTLDGYQTSTMVTILLIAQIITILNHYRPRLWKIFIVLSLFLMTYALLLTHGQTIRIAKNHHLDWPITRYPLFVILWTTLFFYTIGCSPTSSISFLIISIFFYMICLFTYWKQGTFGSMWCWISNTMFLVFILQDLFLRPCL